MDASLRAISRSPINSEEDARALRRELVRAGQGPDFRTYLKRYACYACNRLITGPYDRTRDVLGTCNCPRADRPHGFRAIDFGTRVEGIPQAPRLSIQAGIGCYSTPSRTWGENGDSRDTLLSVWDYTAWELGPSGKAHATDMGLNPDTSDDVWGWVPTETVQAVFLHMFIEYGNPVSVADLTANVHPVP